MSLVLKQETASSFPNPSSGKSAIFVDTGGALSVKSNTGTVSTFVTSSATDTQVLFAQGSSVVGSANLRYDYSNSNLIVSGNISATNAVFTNVSGNGANLSSITGANVSGTVANATYAATAGVANSVAGANVSGTVANATYAATAGTANSVAGANVSGTVANATYAATAGVANSVAGANVSGQVSNALVTGTVYTNAQPNITSVGTLTGLTVGNATANTIFGNGTINATGNANVGNIGATDMTLSGNAVITGNLTISGTVTYINSQTLDIVDPVIQLQTGPNGAPLVSNTGYDVGMALNYYTTAPVTSFIGWKDANLEFIMASNATISANVATVNTLGNLRLGNIIANGQALTGINGANVTGQVGYAAVANSVAGANVSGAVAYATTANSVAGANVSGTVANATYATTAGTANAVAGANVSGQVGNALIAGTVYTNAQPNITSVGTLANLNATNANVTGNSTFSNLTITGTLSANDINVTSIADGNSNVAVAPNANVTISVAGNANVLTVTGTGVNVAGTLNTGTGNITAGNINAGNLLTANYSTAVLTTSAQPNITSVGTLTGLNVNGTVTAANFTANTGVFTGNGANLTNLTGANVTGAVAYATTANSVAGANVSGTVANATYAVTAGTANSVAGANVSGQVSNSLVAGTVYTNAQPNITSVGTLTTLIVGNATANTQFGNGTINATGNANVGNLGFGSGQIIGTGNITVGNADLGNLAKANYFQGNGASITGLTLASSLGDVQITSPTTQQVLGYNGVNWVNETISGTVSAGQGVGFWVTTPVIIPNNSNNNFNQLDTLSSTPNTSAQSYANATINNSTGLISAARSGNLGRTTIDAGNWDFSIWANISGGPGSGTLAATIHNTIPFPLSGTVTITGTGTSRTVTASADSPFANSTAGGGNIVLSSYVETPKGLFPITAVANSTSVTITTPSTYVNESAVNGYTWNPLFNVGSTTLSGTALNEYLFGTTQSTFTISNTSGIGMVMCGITTSNKTIYTTINGTTQSTHMATPLHTLHNDLAGIQGGQSDEYYHLTNSEYTGTGTGVLARASSPQFTTPNIGAASGTSLAATANVTAGNVYANSGTIGASLLTGTLTTAAQPNITSVGTLTSLAVTANITGGNANVTGQLISTVAIGTAPLVVTSTTQVANLSVATAGSATTAGTVTTNAQPNITSVGTLTTLIVGNATANTQFGNGTINATGNANVGNIGAATAVVTTGNITTVNGNVANASTVIANAANGTVFANSHTASGAMSGNINVSTVTGNLGIRALASTYTDNVAAAGTVANAAVHAIAVPTVAASNAITTTNLATFYIAGAPTAGTNVTITNGYSMFVGAGNSYLAGNVTFAGNILGIHANGNSNVNIPAANGNVNISAVGNANILVVTGTGANITGTANVSGNANVGNIGAAQMFASANITTPQFISNVATGTAPFVVTSTTQVANLSVATAGSATTAGTVTTNAQPNITSVGILTGLTVGNATANTVFGNGTITAAGNVSVANLIGPQANGNSNVNIPAANGNVNISAVGNANILVVTGTGANITGTANVTGNANVGNLGTGGLITATGNIQSTANIIANANLITDNILGRTGAITITSSGTNTNINLKPNGTGNIDANSTYITNVKDPSAAQDAATKNYVDTVAQGLDPKSSVVYATTATLFGNGGTGYTYSNGTLGVGATLTNSGTTAALSIDGNTPTIGDRILVKNETGAFTNNTTQSAAFNGIYTVTTVGTVSIPWVLTRATDFDQAAEMASAFVFVEAGTTNADTGYTCTTNNPITVGTTSINWVQFSGAGTYTAGTGLTLTGTVFSVNSSQTQITAVGTLGSLAVTGNITSGNANVTGQLISTIATGTAPLVVTSTTQVANLNVATAGSATNAAAVQTNTSTSSTVYLTGVTSSSNGNSALNIVTGITANYAANSITATTFTGSYANGNSNVNIPAANGNVNISAVGNPNILVVTGTGVNVAGTLNTGTGNANVGNIGTGTAIITTGNITTINSGLMQNGTSNVTIASGANVSIFTAGNATAQFVVTATGANIAGTANVVGNANVGVLNANTRIYANDNIIIGSTGSEGGQLILGYIGINGITGQANSTWNIDVDGSNNFRIFTQYANGVASTPTTFYTANSNVGFPASISASANVTAANVVATTNHIFSVATGISAAGSTQATGTAISKDFNVVSAVLSGNGVTLPTAVAGMRITVINTSANALNVYPLGNGIINSAAANAAYSQPAGARLDFICTAAATAPGGQWYTINATYG
jgi:hypothetical protein